MQSTIKILGTDIIFTYGLEKGQPRTFNQADMLDQIIDIEWDQELYSEAVNSFIEKDIDFVVAEIFEQLEWEREI